MIPLGALLQETLLAPRQAARRIILTGLAPQIGWAVLLFGIAASSVIAALTVPLLPVPEDPNLMPLPISPFGIAMLQGAGQLVLVMAGFQVGRIFGGRGAFADILLLVGWLEIVLVLVSLIDLALLLVLPGSAGILPWIALPLALWILASFLAEAHGFPSTLAVLFGIFATAFALAFIAATLMILLGLGPGR